MGNRASISFTNGGEESIAFFSHWDGEQLFSAAEDYAQRLCQDIFDAKRTGFSPLDRLEPNTVMVDFIRWCIETGSALDIRIDRRVESNYYFGKDEYHGDNSDNGHRTIDLLAIYNDIKSAAERMAAMTATATTTKKTTKPKKTAAEWRAAKEMAAKITGYGDTSPIWNKTDVTIYGEILEYLTDVRDGTGLSSHPMDSAIALLEELRKREAYKRLAATL